MAQVSDVTNSYLTSPVNATNAKGSNAGHIDANLALQSAATVDADANTTAIEVPGGELAEIVFGFTTEGGDSDETLQTTVEVSIDGGSNYKDIMILPTLRYNDDGQWVSRVLYIPRPDDDHKTVKVRLAHNVEGTSPVFTAYTAYLKPIKYGMTPALEVLLG